MQIIIILLLLVVLYVLLSEKIGAAGLSALLSGRRKIILDSCALIDGRIVELVRTGFVADELVVPKFILRELQMLADGGDSHKRERARFGLEVAAELQEYSWVKVTIGEQAFPEIKTTDDKLMALAKQVRGVLCTTDFNLNKVASVEGVKVLNVNELSQSLRPVALPGERVSIKIVQKGSNHDQGVGYLDDGTMIVVDGAAKHVGNVVEVTTDRMHQTVAGKMVFAHMLRSEEPAQQQRKAPAVSSEAPVAANTTTRRPQAGQPVIKKSAEQPQRHLALARRLRGSQQPRRKPRPVQ